MKKRSYLSNIFYVLHDVYLYKKSTIVWLCVGILSSLGEALLGTLTAYFVVLALTEQSDPEHYLGMIGILVAATLTCTALKIWGLNTYSWNSTFTRVTVSWRRLTRKTITTDYMTIS